MSKVDFSLFKIDAFQQCNKANLIDLARSAENAERYEDMTCFMKARVTKFPDSKLNQEERNLLSVAYKNVIGSRRASWRQTQEQEKELGEGDKLGDFATKYREVLEKELKQICTDVLDLLKDHLCSSDEDLIALKGGDNPNSLPVFGKTNKNDEDPAEAEVFYLKMAGDYYRYLTESIGGDLNKENTQEHYSKALDIAKDHLSETHPIRLGLALNYSVCYYEILNMQDDACKLAKEAFDSAISKLDELDEADYKDSTLIMQLLRDNLTLWTSETDNEGGD